MITNDKYIIFYCDDCDRLTPVARLFEEIHRDITVHTHSDIQDLILQIKKKLPELILIYMTKNDERSVSVVKQIRKNVKGSAVPVQVYHSLPEEKEIISLFKKV